MAKKSLKEIVDAQVKKSKEYWADKPSVTQQELDTIQKIANKKSAIFDKLLDTPEKRDKINRLLQSR